MGMDAGMDKIAFGRRLNAARKEQKISSERLSELCSINAVFIRQIEGATRLPSLPVFILLCNKLHVSPNALLADSLTWDEGEALTSLEKRLRELSPRQLDVVIATANTLIDKILELD